MVEENLEDLILIAEDDDDCRELQKVYYDLAYMEYPIHFVENGQELLNFLSESQKLNSLPKLLILDLNMPVIDGREALKQIRDNPETNDLNVIIFTSSDDQADINLCQELKVSHYQQKPQNREEYLNFFQNIVREEMEFN